MSTRIEFDKQAFVEDYVIQGMTQRSLAEKYGMSVSLVGKVIRGQRRPDVREAIEDFRRSLYRKVEQHAKLLLDQAIHTLGRMMETNGACAVTAAKYVMDRVLGRPGLAKVISADPPDERDGRSRGERRRELIETSDLPRFAGDRTRPVGWEMLSPRTRDLLVAYFELENEDEWQPDMAEHALDDPSFPPELREAIEDDLDEALDGVGQEASHGYRTATALVDIRRAERGEAAEEPGGKKAEPGTRNSEPGGRRTEGATCPKSAAGAHGGDGRRTRKCRSGKEQRSPAPAGVRVSARGKVHKTRTSRKT